MTPLIRDAFFLLIPHLSMQLAMMFSKTPMIVENAANVINRKNSAPQKRPPGIWINTFGSVINISSGPAPGLIP